MDGERIVVRSIRGRYPSEPCRLQSDTIEAEVVEEARVVRIRIDDSQPGHEDFWLEITLEIEA